MTLRPALLCISACIFFCLLSLLPVQAAPAVNSLAPGQDASLMLLNVSYIKDLTPFYVGSVHHDWCAGAEREQVMIMADILSAKKNDCFVVDIGMNDGFYTQLAASYGCQVYAFELQTRCIDISFRAAKKNQFNKYITVFHRPVAAHHNQVVEINFPKDAFCDGGFTMDRDSTQKNSHSKAPLEVKKKFHTMSLEGLLLPTTNIDFLKLDVEGFEPEVLLGSESFFKSRRIGAAAVEISNNLPSQWERSHNSTLTLPSDPLLHPFFDIYQRILSYGYSFIPLNCDTAPQHKGKAFTSSNFQEFKSYALQPAYTKCFDVLFRRDNV